MLNQALEAPGHVPVMPHPRSADWQQNRVLIRCPCLVYMDASAALPPLLCRSLGHAATALSLLTPLCMLPIAAVLDCSWLMYRYPVLHCAEPALLAQKRTAAAYTTLSIGASSSVKTSC